MNTAYRNIISKSPGKKTPEEVWKILDTVTDPEIPVLTIIDLGIVREVHVENENLEVIITPTYSGCPAMDFIGMNIRKALMKNGFDKIKSNASTFSGMDHGLDDRRRKRKIKILWHSTACIKNF